MKEVTLITTCEITSIEVVTDEEAALIELNRAVAESAIAETLKEDTGSDDIVILNNQLFIRDCTEVVEI